MRKRRDHTIAAQIKLLGIEEATAAAPENDGSGFARIMIGGEPGDGRAGDAAKALEDRP